MIAAAKALIARNWPVLRLRTILFGTLLFTAALPGVLIFVTSVSFNMLADGLRNAMEVKQ